MISTNDSRTSAMRGDRWRIAALAAAVVAWFGWPLLHPSYLGWDGDSLCLFYPAMVAAREQLQAGHAPLWNAGKFLGTPLLANQMVPAFYPPQFLALLAPQPWGLHAMVVAHYALAATGAFLLARRAMGCGPAGATLAGLTFGLSATLTATVAHPNQLAATAWLPLVWLAALHAVRPTQTGRSGARVAVLAATLGMQMLAGQPQIVFYAGVAVGWTLLFRLAERGDARARLTAIGIAVAGGALAVGLAAVHLLPGLELESQSVRRLLSPVYATTFSLPWANLATLVLPGILGAPGTGGYRGEWNFTETAVFVGQAALVLAAVGWIARRRDRRAWLAAAVGLTGLLLAVGDGTPLYGWLLRALPPLENFRAPARAWCLTALALALAAGWGMDAAAAAAERRAGARGGQWIAGGLIALQLVGMAWFRFHLMPPRWTSHGMLEAAGAETILRGAATRPDGRPGRVFRLMDEIDYNDATEAATRAKIATLQTDLGALRGMRDVLGYEEGLLPTAAHHGLMWHFWRNIYTSRPDSRLLGLLGVEFLLADKPVIGDRWQRVGQYAGIDVWRNRDYRGEVFTPAHWPDVDFMLINGRFRPPRANERRIELERAVPAAVATPPAIEYERLGPGRLEVRVPPGWSGELLLSEGAAPGWIAQGDGIGVPGRFVNAGLIVFELPAGVERWSLRYDPVSFRYGATISALALAAMLALGLLRRRRESATMAAAESDGAAARSIEKE